MIGWVCRFINERYGTPMGRHSKWKSEVRLQSEPGVVKHEAACELPQTMRCYDQLDVGDLVSAELLGRQIQMTEEKYKDRMQTGSGRDVQSDAFLYTGTSLTRGVVGVCPAIPEFISGELALESSISKERRRTREEKTLARSKGTNQKTEGDSVPQGELMLNEIDVRVREGTPFCSLTSSGGLRFSSCCLYFA